MYWLNEEVGRKYAAERVFKELPWASTFDSNSYIQILKRTTQKADNFSQVKTHVSTLSQRYNIHDTIEREKYNLGRRYTNKPAVSAVTYRPSHGFQQSQVQYWLLA